MLEKTYLTSQTALPDRTLSGPSPDGPLRLARARCSIEESGDTDCYRNRSRYAFNAGRQDLSNYVQRRASMAMLYDLQNRLFDIPARCSSDTC